MKLSEIKVPDGSVLVLGIQYPNMIDVPEKIFEYAFIKAGGQFYGSGTGQVPQAAGWGAVMNWLGKHNRRVVFVKLMAEVGVLYSAELDGGSAEPVRVPSQVGSDNWAEQRAERLSLEPGLSHGRD